MSTTPMRACRSSVPSRQVSVSVLPCSVRVGLNADLLAAVRVLGAVLALIVGAGFEAAFGTVFGAAFGATFAAGFTAGLLAGFTMVLDADLSAAHVGGMKANSTTQQIG